MRVQVSPQDVEKRRQQVKPFYKAYVSRAARRTGGWRRIVHQHRYTDTGFVEQFFLTKPVVTEILAMITGQNNHGILQPPLHLQKLYQATEMIVDLLDQGHIGWNNVVADVVALKAPTLFVLHERGHDRVRLVAFSSVPPGGHDMLGAVHITIRRRRDIGPVWFDVAQMQAPGTCTGLVNVLYGTISHVGRFGVCFGDPRWQVGVAHIPATQHLTVWSLNRVGKIVPGVVADIASGAQVTVIGQVWISTLIRMQAVIALVRLKTALADEDAQGGHWIDLQPCHAGVIGAHVGLADEHRVQAKRTQIVSHGPRTNGQRHVIPGSAMTEHVASGIEGHTRWSTDWRLTISAGEVDT